MRSSHATLWIAVWGLLMAVAVIFRPALPVDETRYLAVAWEMWLRGDFLVPHLNGETYSHKPPLLFWLIQAGWAVFGVNDWSSKFVAPAFGLVSLFLTAAIGRRLWPDDVRIPNWAPTILLGCGFWTLYTTLTMFDMMVACCALIGLLGVVRAWRGERWGVLILGLGIGLGVLAKGPVILLFTLPVALFAPWWDRTSGFVTAFGSWTRWYLSVFGAVLIGAAIGLAWAIPAAIAGGEAYAEAIFFGQTAGRMVDSFAHKRPVWWFVAIIGPMLLPWVIWPTMWRAVAAARGLWSDPGVRMCLVWFVPAFIAFSLISGKQPHYLLPLFPAFALLAARVLTLHDFQSRRWEMALPGGLFALLGGLVLLVPLAALVRDPTDLPRWFNEVDTAWGALLVIVGLRVAVGRLAINRPVPVLLALPVALAITVHGVVAPHFAARFDTHTIGETLAQYQAAGFTIGHYNKYHGQFTFAGRLPVAPQVVSKRDLKSWLAAHPKAKIISYSRYLNPNQPKPDFAHPFRGKIAVIWDAETLRAHPKLVRRR